MHIFERPDGDPLDISVPFSYSALLEHELDGRMRSVAAGELGRIVLIACTPRIFRLAAARR